MAIFESAADLRSYIISHHIFDYHDLINEFNIDVVYTDAMPNKYLGLSVPRTQTIFIKNQLSEISQQFIESHELTHTLLGTESAAFYTSSYVSNRKNELQANFGAFFILLRTYINGWSIPKDSFNLGQFLRYYKIPSMYYFQVQSFVEQYSTEIFA